MYADVIFPLRLGSLTYKVPDNFTSDIVGNLVTAPLQKGVKHGLVVSFREGVQGHKDIKEILQMGPQFCDKDFISFMHWMAEYYVSYLGMALKCTPFEDFVALLERSNNLSTGNDEQDISLYQPKTDITYEGTLDGSGQSKVNEIQAMLSKRSYKTVLVHCDSEGLETSLVFNLLSNAERKRGGVIVLTPEIRYLDRLWQVLYPLFGSRLGVFHSRLRASQRRELIRGIFAGATDVVIGTRSVILTPIKSLSLIIVLSEHSPFYKAEESLRYNARDIAVMRAYMSNCPVLLTSISPSLESVFNVRNKKYHYYSLQTYKRCRIRAVFHPFKAQLRSALSTEVLKEAKAIMQRGGTFLFVAQREGYSLLYCRDCGLVARCEGCGSTLLFYEGPKTLVCSHCNKTDRVAHSCSNCRGFNIVPIGGGLERVKTEVEQAFGIKTRIIEAPISHSDLLQFSLVAKKGTISKLQERSIDGAAIIDFDYLLQKVDFRATERVFQDVIKVSSLIKEKGLLLIQTKDTASKLIRSLRAYDFKAFYDHELALRSSAGYPPFRRLATLEVSLKKSLQDEILKTLTGNLGNGLEILGPVLLKRPKKGYERTYRYILKFLHKAALDKFLRDAQSRLEKINGLEMLIDVDPVEV